MAYVPPNTFVNGNPVEGVDMEANFQEARDYLNGEIQVGDIAGNFTTREIGEGEFFGVTNDYLFPVSGDLYSDYLAGKDIYAPDRLYHTSTIKAYDPPTNQRFVSLFGKEFYMEHNGDVLITVSMSAIVQVMDNCKGGWFPWQTTNNEKLNANGWDNRYFLAFDGDVDFTTQAYGFNENGGTYTPNSLPATTIGGNGPETIAVTACRKFITLQYSNSVNVAKGWHKVQVVVNPRNTVAYISNRNIQVETFYDGGTSGNTANNIATNRRYKAEVF